MTPQQIKAKEIVDKYLNQPINFPYTDTQDGQCIGAGFMTHHSAKQCAKLEVQGIIKSNPIIPYKYVSENDAMNEANEFWSEVLKEIDKL
jgi:hypothetical protein